MDFVQSAASPPDDVYIYREVIRNQLVNKDSDKVQVKDGRDKSTEMITWRPQRIIKSETYDKDNLCDIIFANPRYIKSQVKKGWPTLTTERVEKAVNPQFGRRAFQAAVNFGQEFNRGLGKDSQPTANVNFLATTALTVLHEVSRMPWYTCTQHTQYMGSQTADASVQVHPYTPGP